MLNSGVWVSGKNVSMFSSPYPRGFCLISSIVELQMCERDCREFKLVICLKLDAIKMQLTRAIKIKYFLKCFLSVLTFSIIKPKIKAIKLARVDVRINAENCRIKEAL